LVTAAKFLVAARKKLSVVPNFVAITKPFFPCCLLLQDLFERPENANKQAIFAK